MKEQTEAIICVVSPLRAAYSETFIRAHVERLPARVHHLYGGYLPRYHGDDRPLLSPSLSAAALSGSLLRRVLALPADFFESAALKRFLKKSKVSAVLAEFGPTGAAVMHACRAARVPLVVHFHGYDAYDRATLERCVEDYRLLFGMAAGVIAGSRDMEKHLASLGAPHENLFYNPCGVDTRMFSGGKPSAAGPIFLAVGRFVDKKAPHLTLLAFRRMIELHPEARLIMIGDGPLWEACKQLALALKISDKVEFPGALGHAEVAEVMRSVRALVQHSITTSYGDSEGTSLTVLEAGAAGLPVIATRHGGIKDSVIHEATGFLVDEGDVEDMAQHMLEIARSPDLAERMGRAARQRIVEHFSMEKSIKRLWAIIAKSAGLS